MARKPSDAQDNIALFFEGIAAHLEDNDGIFLGGPSLSGAERGVAQSELDELAKRYREYADEHRVNGR